MHPSVAGEDRTLTALDHRSPLPPSASASSAPIAPPGDPAAPAWLALTPHGRVRGLERTGVRIDQTASAAVFVRRLRDARPPVAILVAPPAGSLEVLAVVSERRQRSTLRIVLLNDPRSVAQRLEALALGFDDALPWTIDPLELAGRIRLMLGGSRQPLVDTRHTSIAPGIELDLAAHRVTKDGGDVHLRPKEFALLALLASDPGRVFSREELVELAWGPRYRGSPRTVDVHVRWIRAKLETIPARPRHVVTVRGAGYRLDADLDGEPR